MRLLLLFALYTSAQYSPPGEKKWCSWPSICKVCYPFSLELHILASVETMNKTGNLTSNGKQHLRQLMDFFEPNEDAFIYPFGQVVMYNPTPSTYATAAPIARQHNATIVNAKWNTAHLIAEKAYFNHSINKFLIITQGTINEFLAAVDCYSNMGYPSWELHPRIHYTVIVNLCQRIDNTTLWIPKYIVEGRY